MRPVDHVHKELSQRALTSDELSPLVLERNQSSAERRISFMSAVRDVNEQYKSTIQSCESMKVFVPAP